jgi:hypothetical protein
MAELHCDSVKPAGNVAALREKNPPLRKSHATRLTQRQTKRRGGRIAQVYRAAVLSAIVEPVWGKPQRTKTYIWRIEESFTTEDTKKTTKKN